MNKPKKLSIHQDSKNTGKRKQQYNRVLILLRLLVITISLTSQVCNKETEITFYVFIREHGFFAVGYFAVEKKELVSVRLGKIWLVSVRVKLGYVTLGLVKLG